MGPKKYISLIKNSIPNLEIKDYKLAQKGWDSTVIIINNKYIFRFPKRESSLESLKIEMRILPELKELVDLSIPDFKYFSSSFDNYQTAFVGYEMIPGVELSQNVLDKIKAAGKIKKITQQLGKFLSQMHSFPIEKAQKAEVGQRGDKQFWKNLFSDIKDDCFPIMDKKQRRWTKEILNDYLKNTNFDYRQVLTHGEIGDEHILINLEKLEVSGIIDFGDMAIGDYGFDLNPVYGREFLDQILNYYQHPIDDNLFARLDFYQKTVPFYLLLGGINLDKKEGIKRGLELLEKQMGR